MGLASGCRPGMLSKIPRGISPPGSGMRSRAGFFWASLCFCTIILTMSRREWRTGSGVWLVLWAGALGWTGLRAGLADCGRTAVAFLGLWIFNLVAFLEAALTGLGAALTGLEAGFLGSCFFGASCFFGSSFASST